MRPSTVRLTAIPVRLPSPGVPRSRQSECRSLNGSCRHDDRDDTNHGALDRRVGGPCTAGEVRGRMRPFRRTESIAVSHRSQLGQTPTLRVDRLLGRIRTRKVRGITIGDLGYIPGDATNRTLLNDSGKS